MKKADAQALDTELVFRLNDEIMSGLEESIIAITEEKGKPVVKASVVYAALLRTLGDLRAVSVRDGRQDELDSYNKLDSIFFSQNADMKPKGMMN